MTTELFRKVEETVTVDGIEEKRTVATEDVIKDDDNEVGRLNVNEWGSNFNVNKKFDVELMRANLIIAINKTLNEEAIV